MVIDDMKNYPVPVSQKGHPTLAYTLPNVDRFSKFFHCRTQ